MGYDSLGDSSLALIDKIAKEYTDKKFIKFYEDIKAKTV